MPMDFSEEYVKMCERATPVQELWRPRRGDFAFWDGRRVEEPSPVLVYDIDDELLHVVTLRRGTYHVLTRDDLVWLPRQDQLLELCHGEYEFVPVPFLAWESIVPAFLRLCRRFRTYEQVWLALLMWRKYDRIWNGKEWVRFPGDAHGEKNSISHPR